MDSTAQIKLPDKLVPVFKGKADVRGAYGGRGSGKTRSFAKMSAVRAYKWASEGREGIILCGRQFMNSLDDSSLEEIKAAIRSEPFLDAFFEIGEKYVRTKCGKIRYVFSGLDRNIDSVKSKSRILLCWVDEAEPVTDQVWQVLIPTLREEDSELWVTWNPKRKGSATDLRFRNADDPLYKVVEINWRDNSKFPAKLGRDRQRDKIQRPDEYAHIWEGDYATVFKGAYFAKGLLEAKQQGRITAVTVDPLLQLRAYCDIGGTGANADAFALWIVQFVGTQIRVIDHYEAAGQESTDHAHWLRTSGYSRAYIVLPHDGGHHDRTTRRTYESAFKDAGFDVKVLENIGAGAKMIRIKAAQRLMPSMLFDEKKTGAGRAALAWYHEKWDDERNIGLGPDHDWSSHSADAFGYMAIDYEPPRAAEKIEYSNKGMY